MHLENRTASRSSVCLSQSWDTSLTANWIADLPDFLYGPNSSPRCLFGAVGSARFRVLSSISQIRLTCSSTIKRISWWQRTGPIVSPVSSDHIATSRSYSAYRLPAQYKIVILSRHASQDPPHSRLPEPGCSLPSIRLSFSCAWSLISFIPSLASPCISLLPSPSFFPSLSRRSLQPLQLIGGPPSPNRTASTRRL